MKSVSNDISTYMNSEKHFQACDLYTITLKSGNKYYIADYDVDVTYNGYTYNHKFGILKRGQTKLAGTPSVDSMTVTIACDKTDKVDNLPIMVACHNGNLDKAYLKITKVYFDGDDVVGGFDVFAGICEVSSAGGLQIKLTVKSEIQGLSQLIPVRIFAPQSAYTNVNGTITTSSTDTTSALIPLKPSQRVLVKF